MREIRATNQEDAYLGGLFAQIDATERTVIRGELANAVVVNSAMAVLRLGLATTLLVGAQMVAAGEVPFMALFAYLLTVGRIYAPFDQCLMMVAELFASRVSASRMRTVENADKVVVLKGGAVAEQGSPAQLMAAGGEFARMVELQRGGEGWSL